MISTHELKGPAIATTQVRPDNRDSKIHINKRVKHIEDKLGPKAIDKYNPKQKII